MRLILLAMLLGCALAASTNRVRRNKFEKGNRLRPTPTMPLDLVDGEDNRSGRDRRAPPATWPNNKVCYEFASGFNDDNMKKNLRNAMNEFERVSCMKFIEAGTSDASCTSQSSPLLTVQNTAAGCWAHVGCHSSTNTVNVPTKCDLYDEIGVLIHELFHALGRYHEHTRPDRDHFVTVQWDNVLDGQAHNFEKHTSDDFITFGIPYDYESIMHYGRSFFAKDKSQPTLTLIDTKYNDKVGKQKQLSPSDVLYVNKLYECYEGEPEPCKNGGERMASSDCYCIFPFMGTDCGDVDPGVTVTENDGSGPISLVSLNYPDHYPLNTVTQNLLMCTDTSKKVQIVVEDFDVEGYGCYYDKFRYTLKAGDVNPETKCEDDLKGSTVKADGNSIFITLVSDDMYTFKGYKMEFTCV
ncbi:protein SpAN-like isoform X2 [Acanthaster planci]|uniref:Metalloendopeptidase n=1 Tax=Acanthaster planci TaxID=133434 RepID=A0A8B7Y014_ACAPL|nr:protein SpAN-like isoform X2 [Acanthaster planci]